MATFFLCMIYAAFISLGLPDSLLGAAWPAMQPALGVPLDSAGVLSMIVAGGTVVASLSADRMLHRFGTGRVTLVSVTMTACALLGYALAPGFWWLALAAVPMGLGAGAVDAGLNNFVALHYEARHMSWLHCFWFLTIAQLNGNFCGSICQQRNRFIHRHSLRTGSNTFNTCEIRILAGDCYFP